MPSNKKQVQFIICPVCGGSGRSKLSLPCFNCGGLGLGIFYRGRFFYWGPRFSRIVIELNRARQKFQLGLNMFAFFVGVLGILSLGLWVYFSSRISSDLGAFTFWREKNILILFFWLSIISDMFIIYRFSEEERRRHKISALSLARKNLKLPDNWEELKKFKSKFKIDVAGGYSQSAYKIVEKAFLLAARLDHREVKPLHLLFVSLKDREVGAIFTRLNIDGKKLIRQLKKQLAKIETSKQKPVLSNDLKKVLIKSYIEAYDFGQSKVSVKNFIISCLEIEPILAEIFYDLEADKNKIFNVILWFSINEKMIENYRLYRKMAVLKPGNNMDRAYTAVATPTLSHFSHDLTVAAKWGKLEFCVARGKEIEKIWQQIESGHNGVILTGRPGVGKNTIVEGIAQLMVKEDVPKFLKDKRLIEMDVARLVSGAAPAEAEERLLIIMDEIARAGNIVLYIENVENLMGITSGSEGSLDLSEVLSGAIEDRRLYCLATVSTQNYIKYIEGKPLGNAMAKIEIKEPEGDQAIQILESKISYFEGRYEVYFSYNSIEQVIKLSKQYIKDKYLPAKAINLLELVAVRALKERGEQALVTREDIAAAISDTTGIPVTKITSKESERLLHLEKLIHERMVNQEEAVKMVSASLRRARAELREGKRPIANFLFLGPTGVGKTELAKTVSEIYFGDENYMIRVDMSEYQNADSLDKMIGSPDGTRGYLTEAVRRAPFSLVLLDEFEKAHPDILNLFLQVMDDGRLTDGQGRTIDFTNSIIIATSNAGAFYIEDAVSKGKNIARIKEKLINEHLNKVMRPELINRFDGVIVFKPLSMENVVDIARLMLKKIAKMLEVKGIGFEAEDKGVRLLAKQGYDPKFGARPLRRLLQDKVEDVIANKIIAGEVGRRDTIIIDEEAKVQIKKAKPL